MRVWEERLPNKVQSLLKYGAGSPSFLELRWLPSKGCGRCSGVGHAHEHAAAPSGPQRSFWRPQHMQPAPSQPAASSDQPAEQPWRPPHDNTLGVQLQHCQTISQQVGLSYSTMAAMPIAPFLSQTDIFRVAGIWHTLTTQ